VKTYRSHPEKVRATVAIMDRIEVVERFMGKLSYGADLLEELNEMCRMRNIRLGRLEGLGAVQKARLGYYDQQAHEYRFVEIDRGLEITKLVGNVSLKDGTPFVHAHLTLADGQGRAYGGHLAPGTVLFACEFILEVFEGPILQRVFDETTGLPLWAMSA
jgi:hypothetical protein